MRKPPMSWVCVHYLNISRPRCLAQCSLVNRLYSEDPRLYSEDPRLYSEDPRLYSEDPRLYSEDPGSEKTLLLLFYCSASVDEMELGHLNKNPWSMV